MRKASYSLCLVTFTVALLLSAFLAGQAQNRERFVISAKAGGINAVSGRTAMHPRGTSEWQQLTIKEDLEAGDVVKTGADGRVEMLLNPGSYMRIGQNSEFELADNSLENLEVRLIRGTAIVEATGADDTELLINITTPHTRMAIVRRGLYRVNVVPGDATELIVRKGRVMLNDSHTKIKGGNKVVFSSGSVSVAKLEKSDKKNVDDFDAWSKQRAETVAQANRKIAGRDLDLLVTGFNNYWSRGFSTSSSGVWLFNTRSGCFTFLPFYLGWGSPYGPSYSSPFYGYNCCGGGGPIAGYPSGGFGSSGRGSGSSGGSGPSRPAPQLTSPRLSSPMREPPAAAQGKIQRANDRQ